ncbi:MAG: hypothetical protein K2J78_05975, partial [Muribaculaceae bacterium]|nr:hypothetical protein [Muribaculaceae bacterium]
MRDKKKLQSLILALCAGVVSLSMPSCDNDNNIINEEFEVINPGTPGGTPVIEAVDSPTAILGNMGAAEEELKNCFTNIVDPQNAKVIIIESGSVEEYEEILSEAYSNGVLIAVFNPDSSVLSGWSENNNIFYAGPAENEKCAIYGFNNRGTSYSYHDTDEIDDYEVPLFHLCNWVNTVSGTRLKGVDLRTKEIKKRFLPQSVTHT